MDIYFKPYTACRHTHGAAQAALELVAEESFEPQDIEAVDVYTYAHRLAGRRQGRDRGQHLRLGPVLAALRRRRPA